MQKSENSDAIAATELATQRAKFVLDQIEAHGASIRFLMEPNGSLGWIVCGDMGHEAAEVCRLHHTEITPLMYALKEDEDAAR